MTTDTLAVMHGRPQEGERLPVEWAVYDLLERLAVSYDRIDHPAAYSMEDCADIGRLLGTEICKNLFLCNRQKTKFYLLLMPGDKEFRTKDLSAQINSARLSFGDADAMKAMLGVTPGSASVLGLLNDTAHQVTLLIDGEVLQKPFFGCHPCANTTSMKLLTADLTEKILPALGYTPLIVHL